MIDWTGIVLLIVGLMFSAIVAFMCSYEVGDIPLGVVTFILCFGWWLICMRLFDGAWFWEYFR